MPRQDWHDDHSMTRDRGSRGYRDYDERSHRGDYRDRDRGALFGGDRGELSVDRRMGGWGSLLGDESSGGRQRSSRGSSDYGRKPSYGRNDDRSGIAIEETERLIASNKVEGTPVYDRHGDRLGSIYNFMVDKFRGQVIYAVLRHSSGFLGLDDRYYPLDWDQLTYDTRLGGYHIDMTEEELKRLGSWDRDERWQDRQESLRPDRDRGGSFDRASGQGRGREFSRDADYGREMREPW